MTFSEIQITVLSFPVGVYETELLVVCRQSSVN